MNKTTVALSQEDYKQIVQAIQQGFVYEDEAGTAHKFRANPQLSVILQIEALTGMRIGDILALRIGDIVKDGTRHRLNIQEQKTKKFRTFTMPESVFSFICAWAVEHGKGKQERLFDVSARSVQKQLCIVCGYLGLENISTHSFRKSFATSVYKNSNFNVELVRKLLQHSSVTTTQRYLGVSQREIEDALQTLSDTYLLG